MKKKIKVKIFLEPLWDSEEEKQQLLEDIWNILERHEKLKKSHVIVETVVRTEPRLFYERRVIKTIG